MKRILLFVCTATCCVCQMLAQSFTPIPAAKYQILNAACGYALAYADGQCTIAEVDPTDEHQLWLVESDGTDYFYLVNLAENTFLALGTGNAWNCVFYTDEELANAGADRGLYTIEDLASGNVGLRLKSNGKYLGLDNLSPGSWAFLDKQVSNYGEWQLVALGTEAADAYDAKVASVENYLETQFADNYNAILGEAYDLLADIQDNVIYTDEGYASAIERLNDLQSQLRTVLPVLADIETQYARMTDLVETPTDYPGRVAFERTYETISES